MASYANPQSLNRYSYVLNNPIRYSDPTGHWADEGCGSGDADCNNLPIPNAPKKDKDKKGGGPVIPIVAPRPACVSTGNSCQDLNIDILQYYTNEDHWHPADYTKFEYSPHTLVPVYSSDGKIIGFKTVDYIVDSVSLDKDASGLISDWKGQILNGIAWAADEGAKKVLGFSLCPACGPIVTTVTFGDLVNQTVVYKAHAEEFVVMLPAKEIQPVDLHFYIGEP